MHAAHTVHTYTAKALTHVAHAVHTYTAKAIHTRAAPAHTSAHYPHAFTALTFTPPHVTHMPIPMLTQSTHHSHIACISLAHRLHIAHISLACCFAFVDSSLRSPAETFSARHLAGLLTCPRATPSSRFPERTTSSSDSLSVETVTSVGCPMKKDLQLRV